MDTLSQFPGQSSQNPYSVASPLEILAILRSIQRKNSLVRLHVPGRVATMLTMLLEIDSDTKTLVFDCASDEELNERVLSFEKLMFETSVEKIHVQFATAQLMPCLHGDRPAFRANFPTELIYQQRRILFRIATPVLEPVLCRIPVTGSQGKQVVSVPLYDISGGGVAIFDDQERLDHTIGTIYDDCSIDLPGLGTINVALRLQHVRQKAFPNDTTRLRLGCAFVKPSGMTLSMIQRYVSKLERETIAKQRGLM